MASKDEFVPVEQLNIGLDRAAINQHGQIQVPKEPARAADRHDEDDEEDKRKRAGLRATVSEKRHEVATKIRKTLHVDEDVDNEVSLLANPVIEKSDSRLANKIPKPDKQGIKEFLHNPIETTKSKISGQGNHQAAANIAAKEISHGQEVDLLRAHETMLSAEAGGEDKKRAMETFEELLKERQNMFVRWTLDRHVTKVRVLPKLTSKRRPRNAFETTNEIGKSTLDWKAYGQHLLEYSAQQYGGQYIGYGMDHPAPSKESIMPNIERLIVASAPLQELIMTTRRVYRWENPSETAKYLIIYLVLWAANLLLPGILSAVVYFVLARHFSPKTMNDLRQDIARTEDRQQTALTLTEYIQKEGDENWADNIIQEMGPWLMVQLADLANAFEVMRNFYEWRNPKRTVATLAILIGIIVLTVFVPPWLFVRASTLGMGFAFFVLFPLSINFPEYRLLASGPKRLFWNIPTHAEWSLKAIQAEATRYLQDPSVVPETGLSNKRSDTNIDQYPCHHASSKGHLIISTTGVHFHVQDNHSDSPLFSLPFNQIQRVEKINRVVEKSILKTKADSGEDLKIVEKGGVERCLHNMTLRDQVFSQILGFSGTVWQVVW